MIGDFDRTRLFVFWFGGHPLSAHRASEVAGLRNLGLDVVLLDDDGVADYEVDGHPFHPAYRLLTPIQRSDYLRSYFMHHHGGGYADIKAFPGSWLPAMQAFDDPEVWGNGFPEYRWGVAQLGISPHPRYQPWRWRWWRYRTMQLRYRSLIGNGGFAFRPRTPLTHAWLTEVERRLTRFAPQLELHPGRYGKERAGLVYDGVVSQYPIPWSAMCGDVLQPLVLRYRRHVRQDIPQPPAVGHDDAAATGAAPLLDLTRRTDGKGSSSPLSD